MAARWWMLSVVALSCWSCCEACMCMPSHPQTHFCQSDFAIVAKVQKILRAKDDQFTNIYKVKIKNVFKATPKAQVALRAGRILAPANDGLCGVDLQLKETYLMTGRVRQLQAHTDLCSYNEKWRLVTPRQRKGFRMLYKQGCMCKVNIGSMMAPQRRRVSPHTCVSGWDDCYERHGVCLPTNAGTCRWARAPKLTKCIQTFRYNGTMT